MSDLKNRILSDIKEAMKAKQKERLATLRLISADIKQKEVDSRSELNDTTIIAGLDKMIKQRRESISQFENAGRDDLIAIEQAEMLIIQDYLPQALSEDEINNLIDEAIASEGATAIKDMGKVMARIRPALIGKADMSQVSLMIKARLA